MGHAVSTLGGLLGSSREDVTVAEGVESLYTILDRTIYRRRVRLQFKVLYPPTEGHDEEREEEPSGVVMEEVSSTCTPTPREEQEE